jgi:hypothetical protein
VTKNNLWKICIKKYILGYLKVINTWFKWKCYFKIQFVNHEEFTSTPAIFSSAIWICEVSEGKIIQSIKYLKIEILGQEI